MGNIKYTMPRAARPYTVVVNNGVPGKNHDYQYTFYAIDDEAAIEVVVNNDAVRTWKNWHIVNSDETIVKTSGQLPNVTPTDFESMKPLDAVRKAVKTLASMVTILPGDSEGHSDMAVGINEIWESELIQRWQKDLGVQGSIALACAPVKDIMHCPYFWTYRSGFSAIFHDLQNALKQHGMQITNISIACADPGHKKGECSVEVQRSGSSTEVLAGTVIGEA